MDYTNRIYTPKQIPNRLYNQSLTNSKRPLYIIPIQYLNEDLPSNVDKQDIFPPGYRRQLYYPKFTKEAGYPVWNNFS